MLDVVTLRGQSGYPIAATILGPVEGTPVILAHGGGQTKRAWKNITALLAEHGFRAIAIDLRGHGESAWSENGAYDIADFAGDLIAVASDQSSKPALIGASLGGMAGIVAEGEISPGTFSSLTLVDITPQMNPAGAGRILGFMTANARQGFASPEEAARSISEYLPHRPNRPANSGLSNYLRKKDDGRYYWHWDPAFIEGVMRRDRDTEGESNRRTVELNAAASRLTLPVHLIRGGLSDLVPLEAVDHFRSLVPHAEFSNIADATHMVVGDRNDAFGEAILRFLLWVHGEDGSP